MTSLPARLTGAKCATLALALGSMSPVLMAQDQLAREITFVRALAEKMRFIELAKSEADRLATEYRGAADQDRIAQLSVEVTYYGAQTRNDRDQQRQLFKETVDKSQELADRSSDEEVKLQSLSTLANASQDFGQFLIEELDIAREEDPTRVPELQEEAITVLRNGIKACRDVKASLADQRDDPQKETRFFLMWMKQGVLTREQAKADKENREVLVERAIDELSEMVLEVGEETAIGLRGLFEIAQCYEVGGDIGEALTWYSDTIEQITNSLEAAASGELPMSGEMQSFLFGMMQEVYVRQGETMAREGAAGTAELFTKFREHMKKYGEEGLDVFEIVSPTYGHLMLLAEARFKAESGDPQKVQEALAMTQRINDKHPADYYGVRAKAVLSEILELQKGQVSGTLLVEVGKGALQNREYEEAVKNLRAAIAAMTNEERQKSGLEAYQMLGDAFRRSDRDIEAMITMVEGLKKLGVTAEQGQASEEKMAQHNVSSDIADTLDRAIAGHKRATNEDAFFLPFWEDGLEQVRIFSSGGADKQAYSKGTKALQNSEFAEAAAQFAKVSEEYTYYEQARARLGRAQAALGDFESARKTAADYRTYVDGKELGQRDTGKQTVRDAALAAVAFNEVWMTYYEARGSEEFKLERNLEKYDPAINAAQTFLSNFATEGEIYVPQVLAYLGRLYLDKGDLDQAEGVYTRLKSSEPARAARLATEIFQQYEKQIEGLVEEQNKVIANGGDTAAVAAAQAEIDKARNKLTALGMDYIQSSGRPQLAVLVATMQAWAALRQWKQVAEVAEKTMSLYGESQDAAEGEVVDKLVRPMVGEALLQQHRFQEAYNMLSKAEQANPDDYELKRQVARALGGWYEVNPQTAQPDPQPGLDKPVEAYMKYYGHPTDSYRRWMERPSVQKFSLEWYRFMWEAFWFAKQAAKKDSKYAATAGTFYRLAKSTDDFATLKSHGAEGMELFNYFQTNPPPR